MNKIVCYELNEVPWRVVDRYLSSRPNSNLAKLIKSSSSFTSSTIDSGELHPWSTWPTVHRGVHNDMHNIRSINQDLSTGIEFPPVWEILTDNEKTVGVFGSLQSHPPCASENMLFHIPDTFAPNSEVKPDIYQKFQEFNLKQAGENKAVASKVSAKDVFYIGHLLRSGVRLGALVDIAKHLCKEKINPLNKARRPILQPVVGFDVFRNCLTKYKPEFCTFFSNHVAGIMHRYWKYTFPEDFGYELAGDKKDTFHKESILIAMDVFDSQLGWLQSFCKENSYDLLICSSMGQEAIERDEYIPEMAVDNFEVLRQKLNWTGSVELVPAMQPNVAFKFENRVDLTAFSSEILKLTDTEGEKIFSLAYEPVKNTLDLILGRSEILCANRTVTYGEKSGDLSDFGLKLIERDIGTGYHQPEGIVIWHSAIEDKNSDRKRRVIDSRQILPEILHTFGIEPYEHHLERFDRL